MGKERLVAERIVGGKFIGGGHLYNRLWDAGWDGWELIEVSGDNFTFEREKGNPFDVRIEYLEAEKIAGGKYIGGGHVYYNLDAVHRDGWDLAAIDGDNYIFQRTKYEDVEDDSYDSSDDFEYDDNDDDEYESDNEIEVTCPYCDADLTVSNCEHGDRVVCAVCGQTFILNLNDDDDDDDEQQELEIFDEDSDDIEDDDTISNFQVDGESIKHMGGYMTSIIEFIEEINQKCAQILKLKKGAAEQYSKEKSTTDAEAESLIDKMQSSFEKYCRENFDNLLQSFYNVKSMLSKDYKAEVEGARSSCEEFDRSSVEECQAALAQIVEELNSHIVSLNATDFDALVPPVKVESEGDTFYTYTDKGGKLESYTYQSEFASREEPKPLADVVAKIAVLCRRGTFCVERMKALYTTVMDIDAYEVFVRDSARSWNAERKNQIDNKCDADCYKLFNSNEAKAKYDAFFDELYAAARRADVDYRTGTLTDSEEIVVGSTRVTVTDNSKYESIIAESEILSKRLKNAELVAPVILDLKKCGNILIELDTTEEYGDTVKKFIEQVIIKFLLAFPANKIKFRLIDTASKVDFGPFNQLTKINPDILFDGVVHDSRKLETAVKDMKELMHSIIDKKLSLNNVSNVFEYNKAFEANQQNFHLLVITDFPNGIREELAQDILEIVKNGNKAGIFTVLVHNESAEPGSYQAKYAIERVIENIKKNALCATYSWGDLTLDIKMENAFDVDSDISVSLLPQIVEVMQNNAEQTKQKNVLLETMFGETDRAAQSTKGIPIAAEVMDIPIGVRGGEIQTLKLETNGGVSPHAVVIGGTGSGKSNLLHTIILNTCYRYSPEDVNLYLIDFKGGNEFKFYEANKVAEKQIPHIKLTGLTSDVEDGIAILNNLQNVLAERQELFRKANVSDIVQYCQAGYKMPRLFVIVDEIQELFEQDDKLGEKAISILRELFKLGRAYGITVLWASQNIPNAHGLRDKVLSQIGNRISLKLNEPDDAMAIQIDPKMVRALNRPEKGLGIIKDSRTGNNSVEFRVAYAENVANRQKYAQQIVDKWLPVTQKLAVEPLFIVGDDEVPSPTARNSVFAAVPTKNSVVSKAFDTYTVQFGQNYITGKPFNIGVGLRANKSNIAFMGTDVETVRDMMGYSLMSIVMEHMTNADCIADPTSIYYANGEGIIPKNSADLFNAVKQDFSHMVENVSSVARLKETVTKLYKSYKERRDESEQLDEAKAYAPYFLVIHSLQSYIDLFESNPTLQLNGDNAETQNSGFSMGVGQAGSLMDMLQSVSSPSVSLNSKSDSIPFVDAFRELMGRAGQYGIHFIISLDNPEAIRSIRDELYNVTYKVFTKGINATVISQVIGEYSNNAINNPEIALVAIQGEKYKVRMYRYDDDTDTKWYKDLAAKYLELR